MTRERNLLLGESFIEFDALEVGTQASGRTAFAMSPGSLATPCKHLGDSPNEDALLVIDDGERTLLAVADAHYGARASHVLLQRLARIADPLPANALALLGLLPKLADEDEARNDGSETTLLLACLDRASASGFGFSVGDSTLTVLGLHEPPRCVNRKGARYLNPAVPTSLDPRHACEFDFEVRPGELLLAYTDGLNECHYRSPSTSVQLHHMESLLIRTGGQPADLVRALGELALAGVDGHPGGQDNIALIATRV